MSTSATFNAFKPVNFLRSPFRREGEYELWDVNTHNGDLRPFAKPQLVCDEMPDTQTIYSLPTCCCFGFPHCAFPVKGFCHGQHFFIADSRLYQGEDVGLCSGYRCLAGVPVPPPIQATADCNLPSCDSLAHYYVMTYVSYFAGQRVESSPSYPSEAVYSNGDIPNATLQWDMPPKEWCIDSVCIYRTTAEFADGQVDLQIDGSEYALIAELPATTTSLVDDLNTPNTSYPLLTSHPMRNPAPDAIKYLTRTEDGIAVADDYNVYISLPGIPLFTLDGVVAIDDPIRMIVALGNIILVLTSRFPVIIEFKYTESIMAITRKTIKRNLPLCSIHSVSIYGSRVYFASTYSLYFFDLAGYGADTKSYIQGLLTPEQWKLINPDTVVGIACEWGYLLYSSTLGHSLMIESVGEELDTLNQASIMPISFIKAEAMALNYEGHILFTCDNNLYAWDFRRDVCRHKLYEPNSAAFEVIPYKAKFFLDNEGKNRYRAARVEWDNRTGYVHFSMGNHYIPQEKRLFEAKVLTSRGFALPQYKVAQAHWVEVVGTGVVHEVRLATSFAELTSQSPNQMVQGG